MSAKPDSGSRTQSAASLFIGAMSGTSLDGIDVALFKFSNTDQQVPDIETLAHEYQRYDNSIRERLQQLCEAELIAPQELMTLDSTLGDLTAECITRLLSTTEFSAASIGAIGSHGQTIRHLPPDGAATSRGTTWQIGDPNTIAAKTGITVAADFRRANMAHSGQGAPLAPAFHAAAFGSSGAAADTTGVVNIGGMANVTVLQSGVVSCGFDTGPGNVLMDGWIQRHQNQPFDRDGAWALQGQLDEALLNRLLSHEFLTLPAPKSTGREAFNLQWLDQQLKEHGNKTSATDVQATLLQFTARCISDALSSQWDTSNLYVCGGGAQNNALMQALSINLPDATVQSTDALGIDPQLVECAAFAWFARQTLNATPVSTGSFTGSKQDSILGGLFYG